jgi:hypothetical protein
MWLDLLSVVAIFAAGLGAGLLLNQLVRWLAKQ